MLLASRAQAPRPHHPEAGKCAFPRRHRHGAGSTRGSPRSLGVRGHPTSSRPREWAGLGRAGTPERSLGPAGRRWRAGCGGDANLFRGNENGDCWPRIHCTGPPSDRWSPAPTRTGCSFIATVKGGSCQSSARAHAHTRGGEKVFF